MAPTSVCHLIHEVVELVHADVDAVHTVVDVDVVVPPAVVLGDPLRGLLLWSFSVSFHFFSMRAMRSGDKPSYVPDILLNHRKVILQLS